jgi:hypothetical protein
MTNDDGRKPEGAPERSSKARVGAPSGVEPCFRASKDLRRRRRTGFRDCKQVRRKRISRRVRAGRDVLLEDAPSPVGSPKRIGRMPPYGLSSYQSGRLIQDPTVRRRWLGGLRIVPLPVGALTAEGLQRRAHRPPSASPACE